MSPHGSGGFVRHAGLRGMWCPHLGLCLGVVLGTVLGSMSLHEVTI